MEKYIEMTEVALKKYLEIKDNPQKKIYEAMGYSLFAGGGLVHPGGKSFLAGTYLRGGAQRRCGVRHGAAAGRLRPGYL